MCYRHKRHHLLDRVEIMCKIEVPVVVRTLDMCVRVDAGEQVENEVPAVYRTVGARVLARPEGSRWIKSHTGC